MDSHITRLYPNLVVSDAAAAIDFYRAAFGAEETERYTSPDGRIVHAELRIGEFTMGVKDEGDGDRAPTTPVILALDVEDADAVGGAMVRAGATVVYPIADQPYGQRGGRLADPFGYQWMVSQPLEDLSPEEVQRRTHQMYEA